eukprot:COSAG06_NODE_260_length_18911_cov_107.646236_9_plen_56_part_00
MARTKQTGRMPPNAYYIDDYLKEMEDKLQETRTLPGNRSLCGNELNANNRIMYIE